MINDMNAAMMEASTKPVDAATRTGAAAPIEARSAAEGGAAGEIFSQWLAQAGNPTPTSAMGFAWGDDESPDAPVDVQKAYVPATWLDALGEDHSEPRADRSDQISAVNSDDSGLYRMFRSVSP